MRAQPGGPASLDSGLSAFCSAPTEGLQLRSPPSHCEAQWPSPGLSLHGGSQPGSPGDCRGLQGPGPSALYGKVPRERPATPAPQHDAEILCAAPGATLRPGRARQVLAGAYKEQCVAWASLCLPLAPPWPPAGCTIGTTGRVLLPASRRKPQLRVGEGSAHALPGSALV